MYLYTAGTDLTDACSTLAVGRQSVVCPTLSFVCSVLYALSSKLKKKHFMQNNGFLCKIFTWL